MSHTVVGLRMVMRDGLNLSARTPIDIRTRRIICWLLRLPERLAEDREQILDDGARVSGHTAACIRLLSRVIKRKERKERS
jgi:hypothetical protein